MTAKPEPKPKRKRKRAPPASAASKPSEYEAMLLLFLSAEPQRVGLQRRSGKLVRLVRCGKCFECQRVDCGACASCTDKLKFGGTGKRKQACLKRKCLLPTLTHLPT
jgi:DNA (cytosine-5)-methyltransferase 1